MSIETNLKDIVRKGKISGSWLFCGPFGVGKHETAVCLANYLATGIWSGEKKENSQIMYLERSLTEEAKKEVQKAILAGNSVEGNDKTTRRKKEITVDDIRAGIRFLSLKPGIHEYRILVLSLAEEMNVNAANALLKILEEPFERGVLILITENAGKLLPTICSRCRRIDFPLESQEETEAKIKRLFPKEDASFIAELSEGSWGLARMICQNKGGEIYQKLCDFLSRPLNNVPIESLNSFAEGLLKNETAYKLFQKFWMRILAEKAKEEVKLPHGRSERLTDFYFDSMDLMQKADLIYLDKKQIIINLILRYDEEFNK